MNTIQSAHAVRAKVSHGCTTRFWLVAFTAVMVFCCSAMGQNEDILGRWDPPEQCAGYDPYEWDHYAFSAIHLPSNEVLHWRNNGVTNRVWTASTGCFTDVATPYALFCSGHVALPNGSIIVAGGGNSEAGLDQVAIYQLGGSAL